MAKLSGKLSKFAVTDSDSFANPYTDTDTDDQVPKRIAQRVEDLDKELKERPKHKKKDIFEKMEDQIADIEGIVGEDLTDDFDNYLTFYAEDDEDIELKNSLLSKGRKYARETKLSQETSEITKAFAGSEKSLKDLMEQVSTDIDLVQKDINQMRSMRTGRNGKTLTDMIMTKKELFGIKMQAIKELNNIKKTQFDIQSKIDKNTTAVTGDSEAIVNSAIGSLLSAGRGNALSMVGGYGGVSGAIGADEDYQLDDDNDISDDSISEEETSIDDSDEGRKFLQYESRGVELVLTEYNDGSYVVTAEDRDGVVIDDYPIPRNSGHLQYRVNAKLGTAFDDYNRKYIYRRAEE